MSTTVVNPTPNNNSSHSDGMGLLVGVVVLIIFAVLFFVYALPYIRGLGSNGIQVNVPKSIDVNVKQTK